MIIKNGYKNKKLEVLIQNQEHSRISEFWIRQGNKEFLSYITTEELLQLKNEIQRALLKIIGE